MEVPRVGSVDLEKDVSLAGNHVGFFMNGAQQEKDVIPDFLHLVDGRRCAGYRLADDDGLYVRVGGHGHNLRDGGLLLVHELVGVGDVDDPVGAVLGHHFLPGAVLLLALGNGARHDTDLGGRKGRRSENKNKR